MNNKDMVIEALLSALNSELSCEQKEPAVISNIIAALALIADPRTLTSIIDVVETSDHEPTIYNAIAAFKSIGSEHASEVLEALIDLLDTHNEEIADKVVEIIIDMGSPAVDFLIPALENRISFVRQRAVICLGEIGDERALEPLVELLEHDIFPNVRGAAAWALGRIERQTDSKDIDVMYC